MSWNAICDVCGFKFKNYQLRKRWDGLMVCSADWEPRHPLDFYKPRAPRAPIPWARPEPQDGQIQIGWPSPVNGTNGFLLEEYIPGDQTGFLMLEDSYYLINEEA